MIYLPHVKLIAGTPCHVPCLEHISLISLQFERRLADRATALQSTLDANAVAVDNSLERLRKDDVIASMDANRLSELWDDVEANQPIRDAAVEAFENVREMTSLGNCELFLILETGLYSAGGATRCQRRANFKGMQQNVAHHRLYAVARRGPCARHGGQGEIV